MRRLFLLPMLLLTALLSAQNDCSISGLTATVSPIDPVSCQYFVVLSFDHTGTTNQYRVQGNGNMYGLFPYSQIPVTLGPFTAGATATTREFVVRDASFENCQASINLEIPACSMTIACNIFDMVVTPGDCQPNSLTYGLTLNFQVTSPTSSHFNVYAANNVLLGNFTLNQLPLHIDNFPGSGNANDVIRVCISDNPNCCETLEFAAPNCNPTPCDIYDVVVTTGDCIPGTSLYNLTLDFEVTAPTNALFDVWAANNVYLGNFPLSALPLHINNFPGSGNANDVIRICINDNPNCCKMKEFPAPNCNTVACEIVEMVVTTGPCSSNTTYQLTVNFDVVPPVTVDSFVVFANNTYFGTFGLNQLPLTIPNFPYNGGANDVIKVYVGNSPTGCVGIREFPVPDCLAGGPCEIVDFAVNPGECTSNTTYSLVVNFGVVAPGAIDSFLVFANGNFFGKFGINQLPLTIHNFPYNGGVNDVIKVCVGNAISECCRVLEFPVPACLNATPCHIYDLNVIHTPCLCGQFFAVLNFKFQNVGGGGFDIVGNGNNYGTFQYDHPQPIVLGPFPGDGMTNYEFVVRDHFHPDCHDDFDLGEVVCMVPVIDPGNNFNLSLSPNPAGDWLQVSAQMAGGVKPGQSNVDVYGVDGRLLIHQIVADGGDFQLNVSALPAGMYRLMVLSEAGRMEGTFAKR